MALRLAAATVVLLVTAACRVPGSTPACNTSIDWVNFIQVGSAQYLAGPEAPGILKPGDLGPVYAHVKFKVDGNVCDPNYRLKDGDAAFLEVGSPIYQVTGQPPTEELAAALKGSLLLYRRVFKAAPPALPTS
jgi:hypothetical protein